MITSARPTEERAAHYYTPDGQPCYSVPRADGKGTTNTTVAHARKMGLLPSPTTILKLLAKPQLDGWKIEQACLAVLTSPRRENEPLDEFVRRVIQEDKEHEAERNAAADEGTAIHEAMEMALKEEGFDVKYSTHVNSALNIIRPMGRVVMTEKVLIGNGYAGRTDAVIEDDHFITVLDFKGCKALPKAPYPEHRMQMASYSGALGNTGDKLVRCANIYIDRNTGEAIGHEILDWQSELQKFMLLVKFWYLSNGVPLPESLK